MSLWGKLAATFGLTMTLAPLALGQAANPQSSSAPDPIQQLQKESLGEYFNSGYGWIIDSEYLKPPVVLWGRGDAKLDLSVDDPRYQYCLATAQILKTLYPLDDLDPANTQDYKIIIEKNSILIRSLPYPEMSLWYLTLQYACVG